MIASGRILIADDERYLLNTVSDFLRLEGYECDCADSTKAIVEMMGSTQYDLLISDVNMHGSSETEIIKSLSAIDKDMPILFITGNPLISSIIGLIKQKKTAYMLKPFEFTELLQHVRNVIR